MVERARDLSAVIDGMLADPTFKTRIDARRVLVGDYAMIAIAAGITSLIHYREFCASAQADAACEESPKFDDPRAKAKALAAGNAAFRAVLVEDSHSYRDQRVRAVFAMAPALDPAFLPEGLEQIDIPVGIVAGAADPIGPIGSKARYYAAHISHPEPTIFPGAVGHYRFTRLHRSRTRRRAVEAPGVDRDAIHAETERLAEAFFPPAI